MMQQLLNNTRPLAIGTYKHETDCKYPFIYPMLLFYICITYMFYIQFLYCILKWLFLIFLDTYQHACFKILE